MDDDVLLAGLRVEAERLGAIGGSDDELDAPVAACPGWGVGRLVGHVGRIHRWATANLRADPPALVASADLEPPPRDASVFAWYRAGVAPLVDELGRRDLDAPVFTWAGEQDRRWWLRRLTHETAVHRFDAEHAVGAAMPIDASIAIDGIDELFEVFVPNRFESASFVDGRGGKTMHLHCTDAPGEWLVRFDADGVTVDHEHAKGDVAVRGSASDLFLLLWNRVPADRCEVFGDTELLDAYLDAATF